MQWLSLIQSNLKTYQEDAGAVRISVMMGTFPPYALRANDSISLAWKMNLMNAKATFTIPVY